MFSARRRVPSFSLTSADLLERETPLQAAMVDCRCNCLLQPAAARNRAIEFRTTSGGGAFGVKAYYHLRDVSTLGISMNLDRSFGFLVHDVARLFGRRFNQRALLFLGLTRAQCKVLGYLARNEGIHQTGLADLLEIKPMTLVRQIDRMEEDGWIERRPDPGDRRAHRLVLTDKARPILARILALSTELRTEAFAAFPRRMVGI
jgi:DNA-binding MarR family transcriptional regulator